VIVRFFRTEAGTEPAREYLRSLEKADRAATEAGEEKLAGGRRGDAAPQQAHR
jgi:hypothetical protein